ncbi:DUF1080 domain-containing protein [Gemmatimonadota bacterium]
MKRSPVGRAALAGLAAGALVLALAACGGGNHPGTGEGQQVAYDSGVPTDGHQSNEFVELLHSSNGRFSKTGWNHYGPGYFELDRETGILTSHGGMGLFWYSVKEFADFELELEFRCSRVTTNSGVFVRVPGVPSSDDYIYHSFEIQIYDAGEGIHVTGAVYDAEAASHLASKPPGEWNQLRISFVADHLVVELNQERVVDWDAEPRGKVEDFATRGYVGLQNHDEESPVSFRNIRIRDLG